MINVDISNIWGQASLPDLLALEAKISAAHSALTEGTGPGSELRGWLELPRPEPDLQTGLILAAAEKIRSDSDVLVVIGPGESLLGALAAIDLLRPGQDGLQILFTGSSLSTRHWARLLRRLEGKDISLCVISKSGEDTQAAIAFRNLRWLLERKYGTEEANSRIYAVTDSLIGPLRQMADEEHWEAFTIPADVSMPFSVLSPAGLLPMAAAGIDIMAVLSGAWQAKEDYDLRSYENPAWLYAAVRNLMGACGRDTELLAFWEPDFRSFGAWWQQLMAGAGGLFPVPAEYPAELGSLGQPIRRNLYETMVRFDPPRQKMTIIGDVKNLDGLNWLEGKSLDQVEETACQGILDAHVDEGLPLITMDCGELNEQTLGELFWFFQLSCALSAYAREEDPFSRPGTQMCRKHMFPLSGEPDFGGK